MLRRFSGAIFDLDGTLLDSMWLWNESGDLLFRRLGLVPPPGLRQVLAAMDLPEMTRYIRQVHHCPLSHERIIAELDDLLFAEYSRNLLLKEGVPEKLAEFRQRGIRMCIATATDLVHVEAALKRLGIRRIFEFIITSTEVGSSKRSPDIFRQALRRLGTPKDETVVFEDAGYALRTARRDGFLTACVYDPLASGTPEENRRLSDWYLTRFNDWKE